MSYEVINSSVVIPDPGADNKQLFIMQAPAFEKGGGVTLLEAVFVNGAATGAGTSFSLALHKYSNAGTPAVNGTIAPAIGGTAETIWADAVPQAFVLDNDHVFLDSGEWLVLDYQEDNAAEPTNGVLNFKYVMGRGG